MEKARLKSILESLIFVAERPLRISDMAKAILDFEQISTQKPVPQNQEEELVENVMEQASNVEGESGVDSEDQGARQQLESYAAEQDQSISKQEIQDLLLELQRDYLDNPERGIVPVEVANGWQFRTKLENADILRQFYQAKPTKLSKPSLETLSIIAYRQPLTRSEIDDVRGVDSGGVLKTLLEKNLIRIVGKKEEAGKPVLYGTTQDFLELFQLKNLKDLPSLRDYQELEEEFQRKIASEGVKVENSPAGEEQESTMASLSSEASLSGWDDEEEEILVELESNLKDLRHLEKEIFPSENPEKTESTPPASS